MQTKKVYINKLWKTMQAPEDKDFSFFLNESSVQMQESWWALSNIRSQQGRQGDVLHAAVSAAGFII